MLFMVWHALHTSFVLWLFSSLNDLFFLNCDWYLWRKKKKYCSMREWSDSMEWLFNYHFCLSNLILHCVIFYLLLFLLRRKRGIYTSVFTVHFMQFSKTVEAVRNESTWILNLLRNWKIRISRCFWKFCSCSRLFWIFQPSTFTTKCLCLFSHFSFMLPLPLY